MIDAARPWNEEMSSVLNGTPRIKLALFSCGLGNVHRGFEVSTARWYDALKDHPRLDVRLFSGAKYPGAKPVLNIPRDFVLNSPLTVFRGLNEQRYWEFCYGVEQVTYGIFLGYDLLRLNPDVVWTKEIPFAYHLQLYRAWFNLKYKIIFANGGAFRPHTYKDLDFIQHLTDESYREAVAYGIPAERMQTLTNCVRLSEPAESRDDLRRQFGYAPDDYVVICIAAWNRYHKRIDYLIDEVAAMKDPRVKLLLCGHPESDTPLLKQQAQEKLGDRVQWRTMDEDLISKALHASDVFVLASLHEGLGNATIEAIMAGIPFVCHEHSASRFAVSDDAWITDLSKEGHLTARLNYMREHEAELRPKLEKVRAAAIEKFSARSLAPQFFEMVKRVHLTSPPSQGRTQQAMGPT